MTTKAYFVCFLFQNGEYSSGGSGRKSCVESYEGSGGAHKWVHVGSSVGRHVGDQVGEKCNDLFKRNALKPDLSTKGFSTRLEWNFSYLIP